MWGWVYYIMNKPVKRKIMLGIDISHNNGIIDWTKVSHNTPKIDFTFIKASEGSNGADKKFIQNVTGASQNNIPWGAYHFATWNNKDAVSDAKQEAAFFINRLKEVPKPKLPVILDVETNQTNIILNKDEVLKFIQVFFMEIASAGYDYGLYLSKGFADAHLPEEHGLGIIKIWLAQYNNNPYPKLPNGWKKYWIWQYTDQGKVNGIITNCDLNRSDGL